MLEVLCTTSLEPSDVQGEGREVDATPLIFFSFVRTFSLAVCSSLVQIFRQVYWWSVAMVTRYDVISRGNQAIFGWKYMFF